MRRWLLPLAALALSFSTPSSARDELAASLAAAAPAANSEVITLALGAARCAREQVRLKAFDRLAVIDYSLPSTEPRLWVFDLQRARLLFEELVAHGRNTGGHFAERFSNVEGSKMSSLGLFQTADTYFGSNGYSLRLRGLERGFNDKAMERAIVMHGAPYVSEAVAERLGRLGRSWGCPAVRKEMAQTIIDTLKGGALLFSYYPDREWLEESALFKCGSGSGRVVSTVQPAAAPGG